jgi:hypothetical protein
MIPRGLLDSSLRGKPGELALGWLRNVCYAATP